MSLIAHENCPGTCLGLQLESPRDLARAVDLFKALDAALGSGGGQQITGSGLGHLAQQLCPASLLIHSLAEKWRFKQALIEHHRKPALLIPAQHYREAKRARGHGFG